MAIGRARGRRDRRPERARTRTAVARTGPSGQRATGFGQRERWRGRRHNRPGTPAGLVGPGVRNRPSAGPRRRLARNRQDPDLNGRTPEALRKGKPSPIIGIDRVNRRSTRLPFHSYFHRYKVRTLTPLPDAVMFSRPWAAFAVLTFIAAPVLSQNPPAPPPNPTPQSSDTTAARPPQRSLPRPQRPVPSNVTVATAVSG